MNIRFGVKVDRSKLDKYTSGAWKAEAEQVIDRRAFGIEAGAKANAPVLTGALRNSIHVEKVRQFLRQIQDGVLYGVFQELGTSKGVKAKYFMTRAAEKEAEPFFQDLENIFK